MLNGPCLAGPQARGLGPGTAKGGRAKHGGLAGF